MKEEKMDLFLLNSTFCGLSFLGSYITFNEIINSIMNQAILFLETNFKKKKKAKVYIKNKSYSLSLKCGM